MQSTTNNSKASAVREMFSRIAGRYRLANTWMTWGQDVKWRWQVLHIAQLPVGGKLLDVGTGTGDLALLALQQERDVFTIGVDFTIKMMRVGQSQWGGELVCWLNADAHTLPFCDESFDAVVSGYLLRNVKEVERALAEQYRLLKWDCRVVCLDTTPPPADFWHLPTRLYLKYVIPFIGGLISGDMNAYPYLSGSTQRFITAEKLASYLVKAGFSEVGFRRFMGGVMAVHWGVKKK